MDVKNRIRDEIKLHRRKSGPRGIQSTIMIAFTVVSMVLVFALGIVLFYRFNVVLRQNAVSSTQDLIGEASINLEDYLLNMRQISDTVKYNVIEDTDVSDVDVTNELELLYEANSSEVISIVLYGKNGNLITAEPVSTEKKNVDITDQEWFKDAINSLADMHFSNPHIQNLFNDATYRYYKVISLSRSVELNNNGQPEQGVLLVDMDFSAIDRLMSEINETENGQYFYLCDADGNIIYHPRETQIAEHLADESNVRAAAHGDGIYSEKLNGEKREIIVDTISYTGWKLVGVIPRSSVSSGMLNIGLFIVMMILMTLFMILLINRIVAARISSPILKLNDSVIAYEAGGRPDIYVGGSTEIRHLGRSIEKNYEQIESLMKDIVREQDERRRSELEALQSQINPHFLYNTLDSITWMIEGGKNRDAVFMIQQLAQLFRISLSKGRTIIPVSDEIKHARSYMNIQKARYKDSFTVTFDIDPEVENYCIVKLVIQPLLENAIYYGVEGMDGDGEITVKAYRKDEDIFISVSDNGLGMPPEQVEGVLTDNSHVPKHGSGVGLVNVNNRISLLFGKEYGLIVESELDEGTTVTIYIPAVPYNEDNRTSLENGRMPEHKDQEDQEEQENKEDQESES